LTVHWGATIVACTTSAAKGERLKALGADRVINTSEQDFVAATFERYGKPSRRGADVHKGVDGTTQCSDGNSNGMAST
jgi:NADPH:quinone reductase-like Zn-dependent oxidoreductase